VNDIGAWIANGGANAGPGSAAVALLSAAHAAGDGAANASVAARSAAAVRLIAIRASYEGGAAVGNTRCRLR
jgi:hypothetical protein